MMVLDFVAGVLVVVLVVGYWSLCRGVIARDPDHLQRGFVRMLAAAVGLAVVGVVA